jgi:hypothetical protein
MSWVQVWTGETGWIQSETIQMLTYRHMKRGRKEDWVEVVAHPQQRVLLQTCLNVGTCPKGEGDRKAWNAVVESRAQIVIAEVIRIISDRKYHGRIIQLRNTYTLTFDRDAPKTVDIDVWVWDIACPSCHAYTPVVCPVGSHFGQSSSPVSFTNLGPLIAERYPFYRKIPGHDREGGEYASTCINCGAPQDEWRVMESYLTSPGEDGSRVEKTTFIIPLTEEERAGYAKAA